MKLDLILENVRMKYSLGLLEESEGLSEKDILKGKILINESTMTIRKMLVEEGVMLDVRNLLQENWARNLAGGAAAIGAGVGGKMAYDAGKGFVDRTNAGIANNTQGIDAAHAGIAANRAGIDTNAQDVANNTYHLQNAGVQGMSNMKDAASNLGDKLQSAGHSIVKQLDPHDHSGAAGHIRDYILNNVAGVAGN